MQRQRRVGGEHSHVLPLTPVSQRSAHQQASVPAARTTVRLVVLGEKATVPWDSISF